jgi:hypothetical protein
LQRRQVDPRLCRHSGDADLLGELSRGLELLAGAGRIPLRQRDAPETDPGLDDAVEMVDLLAERKGVLIEPHSF